MRYGWRMPRIMGSYRFHHFYTFILVLSKNFDLFFFKELCFIYCDFNLQPRCQLGWEEQWARFLHCLIFQVMIIMSALDPLRPWRWLSTSRTLTLLFSLRSWRRRRLQPPPSSDGQRRGRWYLLFPLAINFFF